MDEPDDAAGIGTLISRLLHDARAYARAEGDYYRALAAERATHAGIAAGLAAAALFLAATRQGLLSVVAVLASLYPAATIALARVFDHERCSRNQLAGLGLAAVSVGVLAVS